MSGWKRFGGLRLNIGLNLLLLLGISMFLLNFVMIVSVRELLVQSELSKGAIFFEAVFAHLEADPEADGWKHELDALLADSDFDCLLLLNGQRQAIYAGGSRCGRLAELKALVGHSIVSKQKKQSFFGTSWGVFWKQSQTVMLSTPLFRQGRLIGGAGGVLPLTGVYARLRQVQTILWVYLAINTLIFGFIGMYRLSRMTVWPLTRLLQRARDLKGNAEGFFLYEEEENEFNQLSRALNAMLRRISEGKAELEQTVASLAQANAELKQAQQEIIRAEKLASVGRLAAGIAHEIGNPIAIVLGYFELLKQSGLSEAQQAEFIQRSQDEINRINRVIRQLLDFSRPSQADPQPFSLHPLITDLLEVVRFQPQLSSVELQVELNAADDGLRGHPNRLRQVILNLIINAADAIVAAGIEDGWIRLGTGLVSGEAAGFSGQSRVLLVECQDNGPGIPQADLDKIFDPFFTTKEPGKGTGLGLSVSYSIIEALGGRIQAQSEPDQGTAMRIYLPLASEDK